MISSSAGGQQDDALSSLRRRLDYIAANSITPSRGASDCGEYREVAGAITPVIASPLSRQMRTLARLARFPNDFFSTWRTSFSRDEIFFNLQRELFCFGTLRTSEARRSMSGAWLHSNTSGKFAESSVIAEFHRLLDNHAAPKSCRAARARACAGLDRPRQSRSGRKGKESSRPC